MAQDSSLGTAGMGARNNNPGNIGQFDNLNRPVKGYKTIQDGVNAVAQWLSGHKATGVYNGEFARAIEQAVSGEPATLQESKKQEIQNAIASKDYKSAYQSIGNSVSKALTGENKTKFDAARTDIGIMTKMANLVAQYEDAGGDMGYLKGNVEQISRKLGKLKNKKDSRFTELAVALDRTFQEYRSNMTGAAFTDKESREYASVNPRSSKSIELNKAVMNGALIQLNNRVDSTIEGIADSAKYIREYAQYQGLKPDDVLILYAKKNPSTKSAIQEMVNQGISPEVILQVYGLDKLFN